MAADFWGLGGNAVHKLALQKMANNILYDNKEVFERKE